MGLATLLALLGRVLCSNWGFLPCVGSTDALGCLIFSLLYFSRKT